MNWLTKLFAANAAQPIEAVGNVVDKLFTSDDERLAREEVLVRLAQQPGLAQVELNKVEAQHRSIFVAGWRPAIGWVCAASLLFPFIINPLIQWVTGRPGPELPLEFLGELLFALLGLGVLRTTEKLTGKTR